MKKILFSALVLSVGVGGYAQQISTTEFGQQITGSTGQATEARPTEDQILWEQPISTAANKYGIVSTYYIPNNWGLYSADDFKAEEKIFINSILFYGSQYNEDAQELIEKVNLYFYTDDNGIPSGSPEDQGSELHKFSFDYSDLIVEPGVDPFLGNKIYHIDIKDVLGEGIELQPGHYWLSVVFDIDMDPNNFDDRFSWSDSETLVLNAPKAISTELGFTTWTTVSEIGFPVQAFAFTLYGEEEILSTGSTELSNLQVYPNPATDVIYLSGANVKQVNSVRATNMNGQFVNLNYKNGQVDVSQLAAGTYIIQIETSEGSISRKIIKK